MIHADRALAERLEDLVRQEYHRLATVAGGVALWLNDGSPVNSAVGLGMGGLPGDVEFQRLEDFYHQRSASAVASVCTLADPSFILALGRRGWTASGFENVLVLDLREDLLLGHAGLTADINGPPPGGRIGTAPRNASLEVRACAPAERAMWAHLAALGFADGRPPGPAHEEFGSIMAAREEAVLFLALLDGQPVGTGALVIQGDVGWLSADSTLPLYRRLGVQQALQRARLRVVRDAGCHLAVTEAAPGGASQRNMERLGFRIAYLHVELVRSVGRAPTVVVSNG